MGFYGVQNVGKIDIARSIQDHTRLFIRFHGIHLIQKFPYLLTRSYWIFARTFTRDVLCYILCMLIMCCVCIIQKVIMHG